MDILYEFGGYAPILLILLSWYLLWQYKKLFFYYNIGLIINIISNTILKGLIREPRPLLDTKKINLMSNHTKDYFFQNGIPFNIYGMPSGHAQMAFFMLVFIYLSIKHTNFLYLYLIITIFICYQRIIIQYHSITQIIVGAIVGSLFGYFIYQLAREKIKGKIREKSDDNAPI